MIEELIRRFPEVVQLPTEVRADTKAWMATAVVTKSLKRRVGVEAAIGDFQSRAGVKGEVTGYLLDRGHLLFCFADGGDRKAVLGTPWVVAGQALAVELWRPRFHLAEGSIQSSLVWVRLPKLWGKTAVRSIVALAGEMVALDDCTAEHRRLGFVQVCIRLDLRRPLQPRVVIDGPKGPQWQRFVYENLNGVCFRCGCFHALTACTVCGEEGSSSMGLSAENVLCNEGKGELGP